MKKLKKLILGMGLLYSTCVAFGHMVEKKDWEHEGRCPMHDLRMKHEGDHGRRGSFDPAKAKIGCIADLIEDSIFSLDDVYFIQKRLDEKKHKILSRPQSFGDHCCKPLGCERMHR